MNGRGIFVALPWLLVLKEILYNIVCTLWKCFCATQSWNILSCIPYSVCLTIDICYFMKVYCTSRVWTYATTGIIAFLEGVHSIASLAQYIVASCLLICLQIVEMPFGRKKLYAKFEKVCLERLAVRNLNCRCRIIY